MTSNGNSCVVMTCEDRLKALKQALAVQGVALRNDSQLCKSFIAGELSKDYTAEVVADICALHCFLYSCTSYAAECARILPQLAARLAVPLGGYEYAWAYCREYEAPVIKQYCLAQVGGPPRIWPWIEHADSELEEQIKHEAADLSIDT